MPCSSLVFPSFCMQLMSSAAALQEGVSTVVRFRSWTKWRRRGAFRGAPFPGSQKKQGGGRSWTCVSSTATWPPGGSGC